jgi:hypothetical protein
MRKKVFVRQAHDSRHRENNHVRAGVNRATRPELGEEAYTWWLTKWAGAALAVSAAFGGLVWWAAGVVWELTHG